MALASLAFLFHTSFIFTTFAYVARHGGVTRWGTVSTGRRNVVAAPALFLSLPLRQLGLTAPFTARWDPLVSFISYLIPNQSRAEQGRREPKPAAAAHHGRSSIAQCLDVARTVGSARPSRPARRSTCSPCDSPGSEAAGALLTSCRRGRGRAAAHARAREAAAELLAPARPWRSSCSRACPRGRAGAVAHARAREAGQSGCSRAPTRPRGSCCSRARPRGRGGAAARARVGEALAELLLAVTPARPRRSCCYLCSTARAREQEGALSLGWGCCQTGRSRRPRRTCSCGRWKMKLTCGTHLAVKGAVGPSCRRGRERKRAGAATTFRLPVLTVPQRVTLPCACHICKCGKNERCVKQEC
jgi:hypothetical protein